MSAQPFTNHLGGETSLYLKQHAHNPVDWYPWGPEALERARSLDRPIFLSIGYSACHWCHVMEHESFVDPEVATLLNGHFVSIKVDREERPDLDQIYMTAVQLMTGQGGWPMSMFLTPELKPFFGGTYFPPDDAYGRPGFKRVVQTIAHMWQNDRDKLLQSAGQVTHQLQNQIRIDPGSETMDLNRLGPDIIRNCVHALSRAFDPVHGGIGQAPKFPHPMELRLLLRAWQRFDDDNALHMVRLTLDKMAMGGIYDHLGGGFARYSTDDRWLVPHFEKMLYDNALLTQAYVEAYQATGEPFYREVAEEVITYVQRDMTSPEGPFYCAQDADSEGVEGKYYVWTRREVDDVLGSELAKLFCDVYDVTTEGNWEGKNILNRGRTFAQDARMLRMDETEMRAKLNDARRRLFEARGKRIPPARDEKILTSWNGLMIAALAQAASALDQPAYAVAAGRAASFILDRMRAPTGTLFRACAVGSPPRLNAYLEDYAFLIDALISLYEATFELPWLQAAVDLSHVMIDRFWDGNEGGFFYIARDHEQLIARSKDPHDSSIPSGNSMAATALLRLARLTSDKTIQARAESTLRLFQGLMTSRPFVVSQMLIALDFQLGPPREIAIIGELTKVPTLEVIRTLRSKFRPNQVLAFRPAHGDMEEFEKLMPFLRDKAPAGIVTTYICENYACQAPLVGVEAVKSAV
jgi:uncharacterized protein YyaL (SSP411 family)